MTLRKACVQKPRLKDSPTSATTICEVKAFISLIRRMPNGLTVVPVMKRISQSHYPPRLIADSFNSQSQPTKYF